MKLILALLLSVSLTAQASPCDEWANFTKIVTYKFRDTNKPEKEVLDELKNGIMGKDPEIDIALKWVAYSYANPNLDPVEMWEKVYDVCRGK
jgi:hypothetical protein